ncbi:MAG: heavy-metal-associated domain-containing protein [Methanomassiliicoccus sp.]|nr:heavy-metal-associated domain-containing protein [Methanomassiliicoccus sp.]
MEEVTINVKGMKCGGCAKRVEEGLKTLPGVSAVAVDLKGAKVKVSLDKTKTTVEQVRQKIKDTGYKAE